MVGRVWEVAVGKAQTQRRTLVDWGDLWSGKSRLDIGEHLIYIGAQRTCFDSCCRRQLCDLSHWPYPALSVLGPYLKGIHRVVEHRGLEPERQIDRPDLLQRTPPLYFDEAVLDAPDLTYVDLDRAYWSIYTRTTLDVSYDGTSGPVRGVVEFVDGEMLGQDKLVRNALLGMMRREWRRGYDHGHRFKEHVPSWRRRPALWALVMDTLELVMWSARDHGAVYVHTDGAIFLVHEQALEWIACVEQMFGMTASVRSHGPGYVLGIGNFKIGGERAGKPGIVIRSQRFDSMLRPPYDLAGALTEWLHYSTFPDEGGGSATGTGPARSGSTLLRAHPPH